MTKCTWKGCNNEGKIPHRTSHYRRALLCEKHDKELDDCCYAIPFDVKRILHNWVLAHGGAKSIKEGK